MRPRVVDSVVLIGEEAFVALVGEIDLDTYPEVASQIRQLASNGASTIVLDLRAVTFFDLFSAGRLSALTYELEADGVLLGVTDCNAQFDAVAEGCARGGASLHPRLTKAHPG
ncbi:MAG: hypothetical protein JWM85_3126 [Acidimicrobiaceae bacterium]|nr:hypothetical protein [Acidimicrobiaceae bacterium]